MANLSLDQKNIPRSISISLEPDLESKGTSSSCRQVQSVSKDAFNSSIISRTLCKPTPLYQRILASSNPGIKTTDFGHLIDAKLKEIQDKNGLDRANAILDLGRKTILIEGQQLDDETVDDILSVLFLLLNDPSWEVRMDALWLIDVLREEGCLDSRDLEKFEAELISRQNKFIETDPKVIENTKKLFSNLRLQRLSISLSQAAQEKELEHQKLRIDHILLQKQFATVQATNSTLKNENLALSKKAKLADHLGNQNINLQANIKQAKEEKAEDNKAKAELQKKFELQSQELIDATTRHQHELQKVTTQFEDAKAANEILEKTNQQQQTQIQDLLSKNHSLTQELQIQLQRNKEQSESIIEKIEQAKKLYSRSDSLQIDLEKTQKSLSKLQKANLQLQSQTQLQTKEANTASLLQQQQVQQLNAQFQELKNSNDTLQKTIQTQKTQISSLNTTLSEQNEKLQQALNNNTTLNQKAQEHHEQSQQNQERIQLLATRNNQLQQNLTKVQEAQTNLKDANLQLQNQSKLKTQELENLSITHQQEIQQFNAQLQQTRLENENLQVLHQSKDEELNDALKNAESLTQKAQTEEKKNAEHIEVLNTQNTQLKQNLQNQANELNEITLQLQNLQSNKEHIEELNKSQATQLQDLHSAISLGNEKLNTEQNNNHILTQHLQESKKLQETLQADLAKQTKTNTALLAHINKLEDRIKVLTLEITALRTPRTSKQNKENSLLPTVNKAVKIDAANSSQAREHGFLSVQPLNQINVDYTGFSALGDSFGGRG